MVQLPSRLACYRQEANQSIAEGLVKEINFSSSTYQVLVEDLYTHKDCWIFLQLEGKGLLKDAFCSCEELGESDETVPCVHLAAAYLSLYGSYHSPLHQRFALSLWNVLCRLCSDRLGDDPSALILTQEGEYACQSSSEKVILSIKAKTPHAREFFQSLMTYRLEETEETSLKFSNLPPEEIASWREGSPSLQLRYELSYWSDLAKWLLKLQEEKGPCQISFKYSSRQVPNWIQADFNELEAGFYISEVNLPIVIPALASVNSPLKVQYIGNQGIARMTYHKEKGLLEIEGEKVSSVERAESQSAMVSIPIDGWSYVPGEGFFAEEPHALLQTPVLQGEKLAHALTEHGRLIGKFLLENSVHLNPVPIFYKLFFDEKWNLHIISYLFEPGDLTRKDSHIFGDWAYLDNDGFYQLEDKRFDQVATIIPLHQLSDFVSQNQSWLNTLEGFHTHVRSLEYQLTYSLTANNRLQFSRTLAKTKDLSKVQDIGSWVYLEGFGFYPKALNSFGFLLKPGFSLSAEQIPLFIRMNREELSFVEGFFSSTCPVEKVGLQVELTSKHNIQITPKYELLSEYRHEDLHLFDYVTYIEGQGFYELPAEMRLPEKFSHPLELEGEDLNLFLTYEMQEIKQYISRLDPRLNLVKEKTLVTNMIEPIQNKGKGWYQFIFYYQTENGLIPIVEIWEVLRKKQPFAFFEAGMIELRDKRYDWLRQIRKDRICRASKAIVLTTLEFMRLNAFDPIQFLENPSENAEASRILMEELMQLHAPEEPDMGGLKSHLRPYQEIGVRWLWFLYQQQLSGLLCDDMGLGKTHQAMGLIASICNFYRAYAEGMAKYFLIVCPTSVIYHWQDKLHEFLPGIRVHTFYGTNRTLKGFEESYDVLLTSYGILRNEQENLSKIPFDLAIFDEIQIAKNASSRIYKVLTQIKAQMKLGLTGTPIENYLRELKSLFDIVLPSYMPAERDYRDFFIRPVEKEQNVQRKRLLSRLIKPFILRRKKEDVLKDLPEKIEENSYCDLLSCQRHLYTEVLEIRRRHLLEELQNQGTSIPYLHIFALLSSLKQICDHPAVYLKMPNEYKQYSSGKWELFIELLREARESNQKVVVFSQYLGMLDIIEHYLTESQIGFASLRGTTYNRKGQIQNFNQDPNCEVFVGSLQAAGLGVDLTAGSVVIHYDRWWNAARENQATDRVHRIGQTRGVQVFKLITKNTFEEKIDAMIRRKGDLMEEIIGVDDHQLLKRFTRDELADLLSLIDIKEEYEAISDL